MWIHIMDGLWKTVRKGVLCGDDRDNSHAWKYIKRVTNKKNLEASNELFAKINSGDTQKRNEDHSGWCI